MHLFLRATRAPQWPASTKGLLSFRHPRGKNSNKNALRFCFSHSPRRVNARWSADGPGRAQMERSCTITNQNKGQHIPWNSRRCKLPRLIDLIQEVDEEARESN